MCRIINIHVYNIYNCITCCMLFMIQPKRVNVTLGIRRNAKPIRYNGNSGQYVSNKNNTYFTLKQTEN